MLDKKIIKLAARLEVTQQYICEILKLPMVVSLSDDSMQAKIKFQAAELNSPERDGAYIEWLKLCFTAATAKDAYYSENVSENCSILALENWEKAVASDLAKVQTLEEVSALYKNSVPRSLGKQKVFQKMINLCKSPEDTRDVFDIVGPGVESGAVIAKWNQLCLKTLPTLETEDKLHEAYDTFPGDSSSRREALKKWIKLDMSAAHFRLLKEYVDSGEDSNYVEDAWSKYALRLVKKAKSLKQIKSAFEECPVGSDAHTLALQKWEIAFQPIVDAISTFAEAHAAYIQAENLVNTRDVIFKKWLELCSDFSGAQLVRTYARYDDHKNLANQRSLLFCKTIDDVRMTIQRMTSDRDNLGDALNLWFDLCQNISDLTHLYHSAIPNSELQFQVLNKWENLALEELATATTPEQAKNVFVQASEGGYAESEALKKWDKLSLEVIEKVNTFAEVEFAYQAAPLGRYRLAEKVAIAKMYALMPED